MYKLFLSEKMLNLHRCYFKKNVIPRLSLNSSIHQHFNSTPSATQVLRNLMEFFQGHAGDLAVGEPNTLYNIINECENIMHCLNNDELKAVNTAVLAMFDYDGFIKTTLADRLGKKLKDINGRSKFDSIIAQKSMDWVNRFLKANALCMYSPQTVFPKVEDFNLYMNEIIYPLVFKTKFKNVKDDEWEFWDSYAFVLLSDIKVCPYCNQQFVYPLVTSNGKMRGAIDHFLPKSRYPYLSMSIYNWIPCCNNCNSYLKKAYEFSLGSINPYVDDLSECFRYVYDFKKIGIGIDIEILNARAEEYCSVFKWREIANFHTDVAIKLLLAKLCYCDEHIESILNSSASLINSVESLKAAIIGYIEKPSLINSESLGKMKYDLACELGFIKN